MRCAFLLLSILLLACGDNDVANDDVASDARRDTSFPSAADSASSPAVDSPDVDGSPADRAAVTLDGFAGIRIGMTPKEAEAATGIDLDPAGADTTLSCYFIRPSGGPDGVLMMVADGRIVRIDVTDPPVTTAEGAGVGDAEERIDSLYGGKVMVTPHYYVEKGHYLTVTPADTAKRIIFETDGDRVTRVRIGRMPYVEWVEGCS